MPCQADPDRCLHRAAALIESQHGARTRPRRRRSRPRPGAARARDGVRFPACTRRSSSTARSRSTRAWCRASSRATTARRSRDRRAAAGATRRRRGRAGARDAASLASERRIELEGRPPIALRHGVLRRGLAGGGARPSGRARIRARDAADRALRRGDRARWRARARGRARARAVVVGAGAGGVELAFALRARLAREGVADVGVGAGRRRAARVAGLRGAPSRSVEAAALRAPSRGAPCSARRSRGSRRTRSFSARRRQLRFDALSGRPAPRAPRSSARATLPTDERGFVRVRRTLQVEGHDELFAVGDCARFEPAARRRRASTRCARDRVLDAQPARAPRGRRAAPLPAAARLPRAPESRRRHRARNQVGPRRRGPARLRAEGPDRPSLHAPLPGARRDAPGRRAPSRRCSQTPKCSAAAAPRSSANRRSSARSRGSACADDPAVVLGLAAPDDAAAVTHGSGELVVASVDAFRAFTDDPFLVGRVAAVNAVSDLLAKGAAPRFALALVTVPDDDPARAEERLFQVLAGARAALDADGVTLVGGHTTAGDELAVGFAVWGSAASPRCAAPPGGLAAGDRLILTKPLGTGVLFAADMRGPRARPVDRGGDRVDAVAATRPPRASRARSARAPQPTSPASASPATSPRCCARARRPPASRSTRCRCSPARRTCSRAACAAPPTRERSGAPRAARRSRTPHRARTRRALRPADLGRAALRCDGGTRRRGARAASRSGRSRRVHRSGRGRRAAARAARDHAVIPNDPACGVAGRGRKPVRGRSRRGRRRWGG